MQSGVGVKLAAHLPCPGPSEAAGPDRTGPEGKPLWPLSTFRCGLLKERGRERSGSLPREAPGTALLSGTGKA